MSRAWVLFGAAVVTVIGLVLAYIVDIPLSVMLSVGFGAVCLIWLIFVLTVPWNLYFKAHAVIHEIRESRERGITVSEERDLEARRIAVRMRWFAIGAHLVSAAVIVVITLISGATVGYYFAGFYLLSTFFRPAGAYFAYLRKRLSTMLTEVKYPREDVVYLRYELKALKGSEHAPRLDVATLTEQVQDLSQQLATLREESVARDENLERKFYAMGRKFEDALSQLTDNRELLAGVRAFIRLVKTEQP